MIAKLVVKGSNREEAINRLQAALADYHIEGIKTKYPHAARSCCSFGIPFGRYDNRLCQQVSKNE
jgi:acetyl/propionyl-CoA carboxylase alpha subunit